MHFPATPSSAEAGGFRRRSIHLRIEDRTRRIVEGCRAGFEGLKQIIHFSMNI
jgi:hypothetical protein